MTSVGVSFVPYSEDNDIGDGDEGGGDDVSSPLRAMYGVGADGAVRREAHAAAAPRRVIDDVGVERARRIAAGDRAALDDARALRPLGVEIELPAAQREMQRQRAAVDVQRRYERTPFIASSSRSPDASRRPSTAC